jgi:hypothetical protein
VSDEKTPPEKKEGQVMLTGHMAQIYGDWMASHNGQKPPLYIDQNGQPIWLNRKERRARAKQARARK